MIDEILGAVRSELPLPGNSRRTPEVEGTVSERGVDVSPTEDGSGIPERRRGVSDLERGAEVLASAVHYLSSEQRAGRCTSVRGNRQAITLLCECAEALTKVENRAPAREALNTWLAGARRS